MFLAILRHQSSAEQTKWISNESHCRRDQEEIDRVMAKWGSVKTSVYGSGPIICISSTCMTTILIYWCHTSYPASVIRTSSSILIPTPWYLHGDKLIPKLTLVDARHNDTSSAKMTTKFVILLSVYWRLTCQGSSRHVLDQGPSKRNKYSSGDHCLCHIICYRLMLKIGKHSICWRVWSISQVIRNLQSCC